MLQNTSLLAIVAVDTAENEPSEVGRKRKTSLVEVTAQMATMQGDLEKKRCDLCLGTGVRKCYSCHVAEGWRAENFSTSKCDRPGYVPVKIGGFLGIGGEDAEEKCSVCWNDPAKKPGMIQCSRCKGTKYIYFRNADWR